MLGDQRHRHGRVAAPAHRRRAGEPRDHLVAVGHFEPAVAGPAVGVLEGVAAGVSQRVDVFEHGDHLGSDAEFESGPAAVDPYLAPLQVRFRGPRTGVGPVRERHAVGTAVELPPVGAVRCETRGVPEHRGDHLSQCRPHLRRGRDDEQAVTSLPDRVDEPRHEPGRTDVGLGQWLDGNRLWGRPVDEAAGVVGGRGEGRRTAAVVTHRHVVAGPLTQFDAVVTDRWVEKHSSAVGALYA